MWSISHVLLRAHFRFVAINEEKLRKPCLVCAIIFNGSVQIQKERVEDLKQREIENIYEEPLSWFLMESVGSEETEHARGLINK